MALVLKDRVKETSTTTGTGAFTLAGAVTGYQSFSAVGDGNTTYYCIAGQTTNEWEVGVGTYTASGTSLSRDTILASSNSNSIVTFSAGTKDVFVVYPAGKSVNQDASGVTTIASLVATTADINGGTIDGTAIGGSTPAAGAFTTLSATRATAGDVATFTTGAVGSEALYVYVDANTASLFNTAGAGAGRNGIQLNPSNVIVDINAATVGTFSSTGLSVTGTLSATGAIRGTFFDSAVIYGGADNDNFTAVYGTSHPSLPNQWEVTLDGANRARITTTGLSVTGTLSSTGNFTVNTDRVVLTAAAPANSLYLAASGNLGLGVSTPSTKLHLLDTGPVYIQMTDSGDGASRVGQNGTALTFGVDGADGSTERMRIDASGNVGIGVTPSAWESTCKMLQLGTVGTVGRGNSGQTQLGFNYFINSSGQYVYIQSLNATRYEQISGEHRWFTAPSGTAGNAISFTQAMTLDASGNLSIGATSPPTNTTKLYTSDGTINAFISYKTGGVEYLGTYSNHPLAFLTNNSERARIDSSGNVGIGTTNPANTLSLGDVTSIGQDINSGYFGANFTSTGVNFRKTGNYAIQMWMDSAVGAAIFRNTSSTGTAGNPISWSERMRIDASGNVLIGTASSALGGVSNLELASSKSGGTVDALVYNGSNTASSNARIWISNAGTSSGTAGLLITSGLAGTRWAVGVDSTDSDKFKISNGYVPGSGSTFLTINSSGNVGIGTSSPGYLVEASKSQNTVTDIAITNANTGTAAQTRLRLNNNTINFGTITHTGGSFTTSGVFRQDGTYVYGNGVGGLTLVTGAAQPLYFATDSTERMRIDASGNVGIGTASPIYRLDISGSSATIRAVGTSASNPSLILSSAGITAWSQTVSGSDSSLSWSRDSTERMRIDASGNVGIGTTTNTNSSRVYIEQAGNLRMLQLTSTNADSSVGIGLTNDARAWAVGVRGDQSDSFNIRDITASADRLNIDSSGNVGINTTSPGSRLDVKGTLRLSGSTSGYVGLAPAAAAGSTTYTLPSADGTSGQSLTTNGSGTLSWATSITTTTGSPAYYGARAWVNFNGTGTVAIRASVNVTSITDNGTGDYTVNFTTAMPDADYAWAGSSQWVAGATVRGIFTNTSTTPSTTALRVQNSNYVSAEDPSYASVVVFR